jgi:hypothetical protein
VYQRFAIFISFFLLTGCTAGADRTMQVGALGIDFAASGRALGVIILLLVLLNIGLLIALVRRRRAQPVQVESFPVWLARLTRPTEPDLADLQGYATASHWNSNDLANMRQTIENDAAINNAQKVRRASALGKYFAEWQSQPTHQQFLTQLMRVILENGSGIFLSLFALAVFITLAVGLSNSSFFSSLAQVDQARGLITFLVAISAVAVILLTAINIFWAGNAEFNVRFTAAKDLVTIVMGLLGTILGFYFGSFNQDKILTLAVDSPANYSVVTSGAKVDVSATAKSGTAPYRFDILVIDPEGNPVAKGAQDKQSENGTIRETVDAPTTTAAKKYSIVLLLRDAKGLQTKQSVDIIVQPAKPAQPQQAPNTQAPVAAPQQQAPNAQAPVAAPPQQAPNAQAPVTAPPPDPNAGKTK